MLYVSSNSPKLEAICVPTLARYFPDCHHAVHRFLRARRGGPAQRGALLHRGGGAWAGRPGQRQRVRHALRRRATTLIGIVVSECSGQIPVVAATTSGHALPAVALSLFGEEIGADCVMAMPPHVLHPDAEGCYEYYRALSRALEIPVMVQNYNGPVGTAMSPELVAWMCRELPQVRYVKEETLPSSWMISANHCCGRAVLRGYLRRHRRAVSAR